MIELRLGRWQDVLCDFGGPTECDAIITDPPFGKRTHKKSRKNDPRPNANRRDGSSDAGLGPSYQWWTREDVDRFVDAWAPVCRGWFACMTSHDLFFDYEAAFHRHDRFVFAPIPCVIRGMSVRLQGDGPSSESVTLVVSRPRARKWAQWGTLPGFYIANADPESSGGRGKPLAMVKKIVRDYSREGDLVIDPLAGWGRTLVAAEALGRNALGAEMDPEAYERGLKEISKPIQREMLALMGAPDPTEPTQAELAL